jgi:hypothetical protein
MQDGNKQPPIQNKHTDPVNHSLLGDNNWPAVDNNLSTANDN